jgi:hypothetical protein
VSRTYFVFGSDDGINWEMLGPVEAGGAPQALRAAMRSESHRHYSAVTKRSWKAVTPEVVKREPIIKMNPMKEAQLTVEDALKEN